jgi:hypothetical protein
VDLEKRVPAKHPLRLVRGVVNDVLAALDGDFSRAYADSGRPSIPPERLKESMTKLEGQPLSAPSGVFLYVC